MNMSRGDFLHIALSPALGLAILLSGVPTWAAGDSATHPNPPSSSDVPGSPPDHEALVDEIVSRFEGDGNGITVTKVPASEVIPGIGETTQDVVVIKFAGKPPTSVNPEGDAIVPLQQLMQAAAVAEVLTDMGMRVSVTFDPLPADPNAIDPETLEAVRDALGKQQITHSLQPRRSDCLLTESDWAPMLRSESRLPRLVQGIPERRRLAKRNPDTTATIVQIPKLFVRDRNTHVGPSVTAQSSTFGSGTPTTRSSPRGQPG